ncbi:hypothetical protein ASZ90_015354 [hydrocarbon metagenome]|uniref:Uncharacterized protein n=1 Tax=hydrocarbon metagenome TaxID=938273 RepID=A0A0W8F262_9ZZZZ
MPPVTATAIEGFVSGEKDGDGTYDPATDMFLPGGISRLPMPGTGLSS